MKEKKEKKKWGLILFIIVLMIGTSVSFVFFGFSPPEDKVKYNGLTFTNINKVWIADINGQQAGFSFLPPDVEGINSSGLSEKLQNKFEIDITSEVNSTFKESIALAEHQMGLTLTPYNIYLREGFTANTTFKLPIITCKDATKNVPVIYFKSSNSTRIHEEANCIVVEANSNADVIRAKDRLLYSILGVMK